MIEGLRALRRPCEIELYTDSKYVLQGINDWIDNWIQQATTSGPNMFESQKRGYASAGSLSLRFNNERDYLVTVAPPRFRGG